MQEVVTTIGAIFRGMSKPLIKRNVLYTILHAQDLRCRQIKVVVELALICLHLISCACNIIYSSTYKTLRLILGHHTNSINLGHAT